MKGVISGVAAEAGKAGTVPTAAAVSDWLPPREQFR